MKDAYLTIANSSKGEFRDKGSKFIAYAFPVEKEEDWQQCLQQVKKEHSKARHHCYAYRLGLDEHNFRANDDGEPSGTAGRPILGQVDSFGLTNVFVVVVRYFGGTLLGTSGLVNAYKISSQAALQNANIIEKLVEDIVRIKFEYAFMGEVMNAAKKLKLNIRHTHFEESAHIDIAVRKSETEKTLLHLKALLAKVSVEEAAMIEEIDGISFEY